MPPAATAVARVIVVCGNERVARLSQEAAETETGPRAKATANTANTETLNVLLLTRTSLERGQPPNLLGKRSAIWGTAS
jgi:hypothetical protein